MAENELNNVEDTELVEEEKKAEEVEVEIDSHLLFVEPMNIEGTGQDEVDGGNGELKRTKPGILGRLSTRKKKKKPITKEENSDETEESIDTVTDVQQEEIKATVEVDDQSHVEEEKTTEEIEADDGSEEFIVEPENVENKDQAEVNEGVPKRKKSGILRRLSNRKKKRKPADDSKNDPNVEVNDNAGDAEENPAETEDNGHENHEEPKDEEGKKEVSESENTESKKKKPGRLRRLSFSKIKKSKRQREKETTEEEIDNQGAENKDEQEKGNGDSVKVQNEEEKCELPETVDQSEDITESNQPITEDIKVEKGTSVCKNGDGLESGGNVDSTNKSYLSAVVELPVDIAHKALQTIKQVFKPVILYIVRKNPHCFKDIIAANDKKNTCCPTQL